MDVKRLEWIRDFIINEIDNGLKPSLSKKYRDDEYYFQYKLFGDGIFVLKIWNIMLNEQMICEVFKDFNGLYINGILIKFPIDKTDFKVLNRKRKLNILN